MKILPLLEQDCGYETAGLEKDWTERDKVLRI